MTRDYAAEMKSLIESATRSEPYTSVQVALDLVRKLEFSDPELLNGWLRGNAVSFLRQSINLRDSAQRLRAHNMASRSVFREHATAMEAGDPEPMAEFLAIRYVVADGNRVRLAQMRRSDLEFVADTYGKRAARNAMTETFLRLLSDKVGDGQVEDYYTDKQLSEMWSSLQM